MDIYLLYVDSQMEGAFASLESAMVYEVGKLLSWKKFTENSSHPYTEQWWGTNSKGKVIRIVYKHSVKG